MMEPGKILKQDVEAIARRQAEFKRCETCMGGGASVMKGTYVGDVDGQFSICADCAGTGWLNGKTWRETMEKEREEIRKEKEDLVSRAEQQAAAERAFAGDKKRAEQALEMLQGLAARETALAIRASGLGRRERELADKQAQREQDNARALAALEDERKGIQVDSDELDAVRDEVERCREEFRKPIKKLVKEVETLREVVERLAAK